MLSLEKETATREKGAVSERRKQQPREEEAALTTHRQYSKAEKDRYQRRRRPRWKQREPTLRW